MSGKTGGRLHHVSFLFFISSTFMLLVTIVVSVYIDRMEKSIVSITHDHLAAAARTASIFLTVEELDMFHTEEDMERPEWDFIKNSLRQFARDYRVLYVYYWRDFGDGRIQYIIDNDDDEEYMASPRMFYDIKSDPLTAEAVPMIMAGDIWVSDLGSYTESWSNLITAIAPVFRGDGSVYCAAGVDISDEIILDQQNRIRSLRAVLLFSLFFSILSGGLGMFVYRKKADAARIANAAKSDFLSRMSHEIRTPMNAILGISQIELQKENLPGDHGAALEKIYNSGNILLGIINDILDMSKIETGKMELNPVEYDVPSFINDTVQINIVRIGSKPVEFILELDENLPSRMTGDELRLKQILNNLLSNASTGASVSAATFNGIFDGQGRTISNVNVNNPSARNLGLFGTLYGIGNNTATIKNLIATGSVTASGIAGGIVGRNASATVQNVAFFGNVTGTGTDTSDGQVGGIVGFSSTTTSVVERAFFSGTVTSPRYALGGIVGQSYGNVRNCFASATVNGNSNGIGGIAGVATSIMNKLFYATMSLSRRR